MTRRVEVATLVVKVASRCNMDCDYCYIYHGKDSSWEKMPRLMSGDVIDSLVDQVGTLYETQQFKPQIVFHGGEPLLFGIRRMRELVSKLVKRTPEVILSIQTNGTIYNGSLEQLLIDFRANISFSVSVDGFQYENDRHRMGLHGKSVYDRIEDTLRRARQAGLLDNILIVIDVRNDPNRIYQFMLEAGAGHYNILLQDGDYDNPPSAISALEDRSVGAWLWTLFKLYAEGNQVFRIKFFDDISVSLLKRARAIKTPESTFSLCTLTIDTDGEIKHSDTFRINRDGADKLVGQYITKATIQENLGLKENIRNILEMELLCKQCLDCPYLDVCGGGYPSHRSKNGNLRNPSVYCGDYLYLFERMGSTLCH
jgi:uncharacterized protein